MDGSMYAVRGIRPKKGKERLIATGSSEVSCSRKEGVMLVDGGAKFVFRNNGRIEIRTRVDTVI
jgi:hypothetical protein